MKPRNVVILDSIKHPKRNAGKHDSGWRKRQMTNQKDYEDEAFEELERQLTKNKVKQVMANLDGELGVYRNDILEEVAREMEKFTFAFGVDTVQSFTAFVRGMKE